jgi:hypothetical protein
VIEIMAGVVIPLLLARRERGGRAEKKCAVENGLA